MEKNKIYRGFFRKGWITHTIILLLMFLSSGSFLFFSITTGGTEGIILGTCGIMATGLGGGLMDTMICYEYHQTGEERL